MECTICGKETSKQKSCPTCDECEEKINELSQEILNSHKKLNFRCVEQADANYSKA